MLAALLLIASAAPPPARPSSETLARWVEELGDDSFAVREAASRKLAAVGDLAEAALDAAKVHRDAEVRSRVKTLLAELRWFLPAGTPQEVVDLVTRYRKAERDERRRMLAKMLHAGEFGCRAAIRIARAEDDPAARREFADLAESVRHQGTLRLGTGQSALVEAQLELGIAASPETYGTSYAAYHTLTGRLPERLAEWEARARRSPTPRADYEVLAYLHRAAGDPAQAARSAKLADRPALREAMLYEAADWKALAAEATAAGPPRGPESQASWAAYRAAFFRLAGNEKAFRAALLLPEPSIGPAKGLFLNGRSEEGLEVLRRSAYSPKIEFEILVAQTRLKEAFAVVEAARKSASRELASLEILEARTRYLLGEKDKALAAIKARIDAIQLGQDEAWHQDLVEALLALDRRDEAFAAAAKILAATNDPVRAGRLLDKLFDAKGDEAHVLYKLLRKLDKDEPIEKTMARLREFAAGKGDAKGLVQRMNLWDAELPPEDWRGAGEACVWAKEPKLAIRCFRNASTARSMLRVGDLLAEAGDWAKAAENYHAAHTLALKAEGPSRVVGESLPSLGLWLSGHALTKAGRIEEGKARRERAYLLPLGDGEVRLEFARALRKRGHKDAAKREEAHLRWFGEPLLFNENSYYTGEGLRAAAVEASEKRQWLRAADGYEQTFLRCLQPTMSFSRGAAYVTVPSLIYVTRARGLAEAGRLDEALREAERALGCLPTGDEVVMRLVPELTKRGRAKDAEALYRRVREKYADVAAAYPDCAWARNQLAWLAGWCRRDLDEGLKQARRAVELSPDTASYHDTLAEVLFQLGKKDEAVAAQKKAIALRPERELYAKQLKRIEAGDTTAARIEEE